MSFSEQDIRSIVRDELRKIVGVEPESDTEFLPTNKAYLKLGYASASELRKAVNNGSLRVGHEVQDRRSPKSAYASYFFNINASIKRLNSLSSKRKA